MHKSKFVEINEKIANTVVGGYQKIENGVVSGFTKISDAFIGKFLTRDGETVEDAKKRMEQEASGKNR